MEHTTLQSELYSPDALCELYGNLHLGSSFGQVLSGSFDEDFTFMSDRIYPLQILAPRNDERHAIQAHRAAQDINSGLPTVLIGSGSVINLAASQIHQSKLDTIVYYDLAALEARTSGVGSCANRLLELILDDTLNQVCSSGESVFKPVREIVPQGLLINIDDCTMASAKADTLKRKIFSRLKQAIIQRGTGVKSNHAPCILYLDDECLRYSLNFICWLLNEAPAHDVCLVLAHKSPRQFIPSSSTAESYDYELLESALATSSLVIFKPSARDAMILGTELDISPLALRDVSPFCATVRKISEGRTCKPISVAFPKPKEVHDGSNLACLIENMKATDRWAADDDLCAKEQVSPKVKHRGCTTAEPSLPANVPGKTGASWSEFSSATKKPELHSGHAEIIPILDALIQHKEEEQ